MKRVLCATAGMLAFASPAMGAARPYDLDGDGRQELVAGLPSLDAPDSSSAGAALVLRGSASGLSSQAQLVRRSASGFPGDPIPYERLGRRVASGDFNGDGYSDIATNSDRHDAVTTIVVYGSADGLVQSSAQERISPRSPMEMSSADVNGDGYSDLAVWSGRPGPVEIFRGGPGGLRAQPSASLAVRGAIMRFADLNRDHHPELVYSTFEAIGVCRGSGAGPARCLDVPLPARGTDVGIGDVTGDRRLEVVVGTPHYREGRGAVHVYRYRRGGLHHLFKVTQDTRGVPGNSEIDDLFGYAVEVGRIGSPRKATIVIGSPNEDIGEGRVTLVHGARRGIAHRGNRALDLDSPGVPGNESMSAFGAAVTMLDHDGDGRRDLDVGSPSGDGTGRVIAFRGGRHGLRRRARRFRLSDLSIETGLDDVKLGRILGRR